MELISHWFYQQLQYATPTTLKTVESFNYSLTAADLSLSEAIDLDLAYLELINLANLSGAQLKVTKDGNIIFCFPSNFRNILRNKYIKARILDLLEKCWNWIKYLFKIFFGIFLLLSILLLGLAVISIALAASRNNHNESSRGNSTHSFAHRYGHNTGFRAFDMSDIFWLFYWESHVNRRRRYGHHFRRYGSGGDPPDPPPQRSISHMLPQSNDDNGMNFFESIFSFIFGDGNPNADLEQRRIQAIGSLIRHNEGVVFAEQIYPYLDTCLLGENKANKKVDEEEIFFILDIFNGRPEATNDGKLVYKFPQLQSAVSIDITPDQNVAIITPPLYENKWDFSIASDKQISIAIFLGMINLIECLILYEFVDREAYSQYPLVDYVFSYSWIFATYAILYFVIPLIRFLVILVLNQRIENRNLQRKQQLPVLIKNLVQQTDKLVFAREKRMNMKIEPQDIVFTTKSQYPELELEAFKDTHLETSQI